MFFENRFTNNTPTGNFVIYTSSESWKTKVK